MSGLGASREGSDSKVFTKGLHVHEDRMLRQGGTLVRHGSSCHVVLRPRGHHVYVDTRKYLELIDLKYSVKERTSYSNQPQSPFIYYISQCRNPSEPPSLYVHTR